MTKRIVTLAVFAATIGLIAPALATAATIAGRVKNFSPTSVAVFDKELVTVNFDHETAFTKIITERPWQADTALTPKALFVGAYVVVHVPRGSNVADWVQIRRDTAYGFAAVSAIVQPIPLVASAYPTDSAFHRAEAAARRAAPNASESKRPGSPGTALHCDRIADRLEKAGK